MALTNIIVPAFPDVPRAPGVPSVLRQVGALANNVVMLAADVASIARMFLGPQWGIFKDGAPIFVGDSVLGVDYRREWRVSDFPIEAGGFASYNKVQVPFDVRVIFSVSGAGSLLSSLIPGGAGWMAAPNRTEMLTVLKLAAESLDLYSVHTPELNYDNCNIVHYDYRREARSGTTLIKVEVWLTEIRIAPKAALTQTQAPAAADPVNQGTGQAGPVSPGTAANLPPSEPGNLPSPPTTGTGGLPIPADNGGGTVPYYDINGNQIGIAPEATPSTGPIVGYSSGPGGDQQPIIGGAWQQGFFDANHNWISPNK